MAKNDGGPAFPRTATAFATPSGMYGDHGDTGMSLRDWFAGNAPSVPSWFVVEFFGWPDDLSDKAIEWRISVEPTQPNAPDRLSARWGQLPWSEKKRCEMAWPNAYAHLMLVEREKADDDK